MRKTIVTQEANLCVVGLCGKRPLKKKNFAALNVPVLSRILSSPEKLVLLRWTIIESDASGNKRPDAILTKLTQLSNGPSLGFGEARVAQRTTNNNGLCHGLLRLGIFCKEAIDAHYWNACLAFQIHGFTIVFY